jgi:hypothetical protein
MSAQSAVDRQDQDEFIRHVWPLQLKLRARRRHVEHEAFAQDRALAAGHDSALPHKSAPGIPALDTHDLSPP